MRSTLLGVFHVRPHEPVRFEPQPSAADRLDSWKEIAVYLKRSVRSVRRWESEEGSYTGISTRVPALFTPSRLNSTPGGQPQRRTGIHRVPARKAPPGGRIRPKLAVASLRWAVVAGWPCSSRYSLP